MDPLRSGRQTDTSLESKRITIRCFWSLVSLVYLVLTVVVVVAAAAFLFRVTSRTPALLVMLRAHDLRDSLIRSIQS